MATDKRKIFILNPYHEFPDYQFWNRDVGNTLLENIQYDATPKFTFDIAKDKFVTAGSCFAQHFARELVAMGGQHYVAEPAHPVLPETSKQGYGVFSARYGNIYSVRQLRELLEQVYGLREPILDFVQDENRRWFDLLRPRVTVEGFSSIAEATADRHFHLAKVAEMFSAANVFVFTLGLTELWYNVQEKYAYPMCPGTVVGEFKKDIHKFCNQTFGQVLADLQASMKILAQHAPHLKVLLTVSPVLLVATAESRSVLQSSTVSKSILRAASDQCCKEFDFVDYFPSFEIISNSKTRGRFYSEDARDVKPEGVKLVMSCFFKSRFDIHGRAVKLAQKESDTAVQDDDISKAFEVECDEILLDKN